MKKSDKFYPSADFQKQAYAGSFAEYQDLAKFVADNPEKFWSELADEYIDWFSAYESVLNSDEAPFYRWFDGGKLNASHLCVDRHLGKNGKHTALIWEAENGEVRKYSYEDLSKEVFRFARILKTEFGIKKGDRVVLYLPMIPEAIFAMLACARIGAIHAVVFGGFSAEVLGERIADTGAKLVITADGAFRHGKPYLLKPTVDKALKNLEQKKPKTLVIEHNHEPIDWIDNQDFSYGELNKKTSVRYLKPEVMDSEDVLFILHTSGSTGKPKGIVHSTAGYMLWAQYTSKMVFDLHDEDIFWCTADIGWITGHTYLVYGPLALGRTIVMYEGVLTYPDTGRPWRIIENHKVNAFYTAPTAIRMLHKDGADEPEKYDLSSLKVLGTVGEPIDPESWKWYYEKVGKNRCPIVDTWWQTETGGHLVSPLPGATPIKPGSATFPLPGIESEILDEKGHPVDLGQKGLLCITKPWPAMFRNVWNDPDRYKSTYFSIVKNGVPVYFSGDGAYVDKEGYTFVTGRVDDVINISGHRVGTAEVESVISSHPFVAEVAIVSRLDHLRGEQIVAFVILEADLETNILLTEINLLLKKDIGAIIKVERIIITSELPKTRSGKILRRLLRSIVRGEVSKVDISTIDNPEIVKAIESRLQGD